MRKGCRHCALMSTRLRALWEGSTREQNLKRWIPGLKGLQVHSVMDNCQLEPDRTDAQKWDSETGLKAACKKPNLCEEESK